MVTLAHLSNRWFMRGGQHADDHACDPANLLKRINGFVAILGQRKTQIAGSSVLLTNEPQSLCMGSWCRV